jgi:tetratricopeptide (TPR) repeat protein
VSGFRRYNSIVARTWLLVPLLLLPFALSSAQEKKPPAPPQTQEAEPPEEDESLKKSTREYSFNPIQAAQELKIGNYYFKKGAFKSAALRFQESTRWDPNSAEAWLRLGEAHEKLRDRKAAGEAYTKYLELAPDAKNADSIRKKLAGKK